MRYMSFIRALFIVSAIYDITLGLAFLCCGPQIFDRFKVTPPNHWGYVHFSAELIIIFGLMFLAVAAKPIRIRNLIPFGVLLKLAYATTVFIHWYQGGVPAMWLPFAWCDLGFALLFIVAYRITGMATPTPMPRR